MAWQYVGVLRIATNLSNTVMEYHKSIPYPITEISKCRSKIANIAIFSEWNI